MSPRTFKMLGTLLWVIIIIGVFVAVIFAGRYAFAHVGEHIVYCKDGTILREWQIDRNGDGKADYAKYVLDGETEPFAEIFATLEGEAIGGRVLGKEYDSLEAMQKAWPSICHAARYVKKKGLKI